MKTKDVRFGMKVVPNKKTSDGRVQGLENSAAWYKAKEKNQNFLYVNMIPLKNNYPEYMLGVNYNDGNGDYFHVSDFEKYTE